MLTRLSTSFSAGRRLSAREQRILWLALLLAVLMLLSRGLPAISAHYQSTALRIDTLRADIEREQRLIDDAGLWQQRRAETTEQVQALQSSLFSGNSTALLTAAVQRQVRQIAEETGLSINATNLAENQQSGDWIVVQQTLTFSTTDQNNILRFLQQLTERQPRLKVTGLSLRPARNQYSGELTVVGFSR